MTSINCRAVHLCVASQTHGTRVIFVAVCRLLKQALQAKINLASKREREEAERERKAAARRRKQAKEKADLEAQLTALMNPHEGEERQALGAGGTPDVCELTDEERPEQAGLPKSAAVEVSF